MGVPAVNIGSRQAGRERGVNVIDVGCDRAEIAVAIRNQMANGPYPRDNFFGDGLASGRIVKILAESELGPQKKFRELSAPAPRIINPEHFREAVYGR